MEHKIWLTPLFTGKKFINKKNHVSLFNVAVLPDGNIRPYSAVHLCHLG